MKTQIHFFPDSWLMRHNFDKLQPQVQAVGGIWCLQPSCSSGKVQKSQQLEGMKDGT